MIKVVGCDVYNMTLTDGTACTLTSNTGLGSNHAGPSVLIENTRFGCERCGEYLAGFQNTGRGWWNQREVAATVRAELDSGVGPNVVLFLR